MVYCYQVSSLSFVCTLLTKGGERLNVPRQTGCAHAPPQAVILLHALPPSRKGRGPTESTVASGVILTGRSRHEQIPMLSGEGVRAWAVSPSGNEAPPEAVPRA